MSCAAYKDTSILCHQTRVKEGKTPEQMLHLSLTTLKIHPASIKLNGENSNDKYNEKPIELHGNIKHIIFQ